ncbi:MAG: glycosyltransferase family 4 protein [Nitrospinota bacterium]
MREGVLRSPAPAARGEDGRPLSILQIMTCRGWSSDAWAAVALTLGLQEAGHRVLLLCREVERGRMLAERAGREGVREVDFIEGSGNLRPASYLRDLVKLRRLARERQVEAVHVHRGVEHWLVAAAWPGRRGPVIVRSRHIMQPVRRHLFNRWLYGRGTDRVVAVSERIRRGYLEGAGFAPGRFRTVMGGGDARAFDPDARGERFRQAWGIPPRAWVAGVAGSVRLWLKGQDVLLRAVARMGGDERGFPWVVVVGQGEDLERLKALAAELGMGGRVVFPGFLDSMGEALAACDALAFPSRRSEGTSRVLFDYLAAGRPVAASRVGCVEEIVREGSEGVLVPPADEEALAGALERLRRSPEAARAMGASGRRRAEEEFDRRVVARRTVEIYREALRERGRGAA